MKKFILKIMLVLSLVMTISFISETAQAYYVTGYGYNCGWVGGHWWRGHWYPAHKVCHSYGRCGWVGGHWWRGYWYPAHRVCR